MAYIAMAYIVLYVYGPCSYGLYSYGLHSYGLCSYGLWHAGEIGVGVGHAYRPLYRNFAPHPGIARWHMAYSQVAHGL